MLDMDKGMEAFLEREVMFMAFCWKIERTDGVVLRFTDHVAPLVLFDGETYTPVGGGEASATERETAMKVHNREFVGAITSDAITAKDLASGFYRNAKVTEYLINPMHPWLSYFEMKPYWIGGVTQNGEVWQAEIEGLGGILAKPKGTVFSKTCDWLFCDSRCTLALESFQKGPYKVTYPGDDDSDPEQVRWSFAIMKISGDHYPPYDERLPWCEAGHYEGGHVTWITGDNAGTTQRIKRNYEQDPGFNDYHYIVLAEEAPEDIAAGDTFYINRGCTKTLERCREYGNVINFGGFPYIPGSDNMLETVDSYA